MKPGSRSVWLPIAALFASTMATAVMSGQKGSGPGALVLTNYSSGNIAVPIPDANATGVDIPIVVTDTNLILDVNVSFRINHTFDGDLAISLVHPDNTVIPLVTNRGGGGDNFGTGPNNSTGILTIIDDEAATPITSGTAPFAGAFRPESVPAGSALSLLDGKPANGTWKLRVVDTAAADTGTIGVFNLHLSTNCVCPDIQAEPPPVLTAEGIGPGNNAADPNETVTVNLALRNLGSINTSNLVGTLQATGGVVNPSGPQDFGVVVAGGEAVTRPFTFTATGACGGTLLLTLSLQDGATSLGVLTYTLRIGVPFAPVTFTNSGAIVIPGTGTGDPAGAPAAPYPSNIVVSGISGPIDNLTVRLNAFNHTFPDDVDVLLVSPSGVNMIIFSDAGGTNDAVGVDLTLDDAAVNSLGDGTANPTGTYWPGNFGTVSDPFPVPAPAAPYVSPAPGGSATLATAFDGVTANGTWSLYVVDDVGGDAGNFNGGWSLSITPSGALCQTATVPSAPTGVGAAAKFGKATVTFNASASNGSAITGYTVVSTPAGGVDSNAGSTGLSHVVTGLTNGVAYAFRVRATNLVGNSALSGLSNTVTPPGFTDFPLVAGVTRIKAVHIIELRQRIDLLRLRFGLAGFAWTDPVLSPGGTPVRAAHITDLRTALTQAYVAGGFSPLPTFIDTPLGPGVVIKQVHITQIQSVLVTIE